MDRSSIKRKLELRSALNLHLISPESSREVSTKMVVTFAYAHWEGFYNDCVDEYIAALKTLDSRISRSDWNLKVSILDRHIDSMEGRGFSRRAKLDFAEFLKKIEFSHYSEISSKFLRLDRI